MDFDKAKYLKPSRSDGEKRLQERGELIVWFRDQLNIANTVDGKRKIEIGELVRKLQHIKTKDLGRDLYFLRKKCEEALDSGFPIGAVFFPTVKRLVEGIKSEPITKV